MDEEVLRAQDAGVQDHIFYSRPPQHTSRGLPYDCREGRTAPSAPMAASGGVSCAASPSCASSTQSMSTPSARALREEEVASFVEQIRAAGGHEDDDDGGKRREFNMGELFVSLT
ncbi:hypothetical protein U9M48_044567 [Paspalum notatum var. saurae]|uniref:Uncharacterized protein n=1 Tax=Paspalum notatum var. saurae TaxID=547442 RepID=A0AAQ3UVC4_PASNO